MEIYLFKWTPIIVFSSFFNASLHSHLIEHLNAEIVLQTITDVSIALDWLKSTFLFVRIKKNPKHYGTFIMYTCLQALEAHCSLM